MGKLTLDEAIRHCLEVAEDNERAIDCLDLWEEEEQEQANMCRECAAEHRQIAEWLTDYKKLREFNDKVCDMLAEQFGCPCDCIYALGRYMQQNGGCNDCSVKISNKECWSRYIRTKLTRGSEDE